MITLLVEDFFEAPNGGKDPLTAPCIKYFELCSDDEHGWGWTNRSTLREFSDHALFNLKKIIDYDPENDVNPFYVISVSNDADWHSLPDNSTLWSVIPESNKKRIIEHNIPVLIWNSYEITSNVSGEDIENFIRSKTKEGLQNIKTIIFSLSDRFDRGEISKKLLDNNVIFAYSSLFFSIMKNEKKDDDAIIGKKKLKYLTLDQVDPRRHSKKHDFLCLNHLSRPNRKLLCQTLYSQNELWNNSLISAIERPYAHTPYGYVAGGPGQRVDDKERELQLNAIRDFFKLMIADKDLVKDRIFHNFLSFEKHDPGNFWFTILKNKMTEGCTRHKELITFVLDHNKDWKKSNLVQFAVDYMVGTVVKGAYPSIYLDTKKVSSTEDLNNKWEDSWYRDTWFSLVTETCALSWQGGELTEKITKPIINYHPFIIFGSSGATRNLELLGFKSFNKSLLGIPRDYEYGNIAPVERMMHLLKGLKRFHALSYNQKISIWKSILPDIKHNRNHLVSNDWIRVAHKELFMKRKKLT